jgi:hypothetical protein
MMYSYYCVGVPKKNYRNWDELLEVLKKNSTNEKTSHEIIFHIGTLPSEGTSFPGSLRVTGTIAVLQEWRKVANAAQAELNKSAKRLEKAS